MSWLEEITFHTMPKILNWVGTPRVPTLLMYSPIVATPARLGVLSACQVFATGCRCEPRPHADAHRRLERSRPRRHARLLRRRVHRPRRRPHHAHGDDQVDAEFAFFDAFRGATAPIADTISEPDRIVVRWAVTGTHDGEFAGIAPTGNEITYEEWAVYDVVDGELAGVRAIRNELDMLVDLGIVDWPPE